MKETSDEVDDEGHHLLRQENNEGDRPPSEANGVENGILQDADDFS